MEFLKYIGISFVVTFVLMIEILLSVILGSWNILASIVFLFICVYANSMIVGGWKIKRLTN